MDLGYGAHCCEGPVQNSPVCSHGAWQMFCLMLHCCPQGRILPESEMETMGRWRHVGYSRNERPSDYKTRLVGGRA
jgi:hypothetical protein